MLTSKVGERGNLGNKSDKKTNHVFVFLEVFVHEGGIQSYVKDIFRVTQSFYEYSPADDYDYSGN